MGELPPEGPCIPVGCRGTCPLNPQGPGGTQDPTLGATEEMPGGKYLPAPTSSGPNTQVDGQDLQGSIAKLLGCRRAHIPRECWQPVDP